MLARSAVGIAVLQVGEDVNLSQGNVESLKNLYAGDYLRHLHIIVSDYWTGHEKHRDGLLPYTWDTLDQPDPDPTTPPDTWTSFQLSSLYHHAKVTLVATADGGRYVIHGSANLRSTRFIEVIAIEHDPALFDFHRAWLAAVEQQFATINHAQPHPASRKTPRLTQSWQQIQASTKKSTTPANAPPTSVKPRAPRAPSSAAKSNTDPQRPFNAPAINAQGQGGARP